MTTKTTPGTSRPRLTGASVGIPPRHIDFDFPDNAPRYFAGDNNVVVTALMAVFSAIFPPGEDFFVESVRYYRNQVTDPELQAKISGFIGQEALHTREHEHLNEWFTGKGFDLAMPDRMIRFSLGLLEKLPPSQQLACTTLMEHFTAHLAEEWLTNDSFRKGFDPEMLKLWSWHALEELEHKSVAYDVHQQISKNEHLERVLAGPLVGAALLPGIIFSIGWIVARDGQGLNLRENVRGIKSLLGKQGFVTRVLRHVPAFSRAGFHPEKRNTKPLEQKWREALFGKNGELEHAYRNRAAIEASSGAAA